MSALNWWGWKVDLMDHDDDDTTNPASASTTYYGPEFSYAVRVLGASFYSEDAITGDTTAHYDIGVYAGSTKIAELTLHTSTNHTANDYTDLTMQTANSTDTTAVVAAGTTLTVGAVKVGSPSNLHTQSWVIVELAPLQPF